MTKVVILDLGSGDFDSGFPYISARLKYSNHEEKFSGSLPPIPELNKLNRDWKLLYDALNRRFDVIRRRLFEVEEEGQIIHVSFFDFQNLCEKIEDTLNQWLNSPSFAVIDRKLRTHFKLDEEIKIIIEIKERSLYSFPWHLWHLLREYPYAEIAVNLSPSYAPPPPRKHRQTRILAVLGHSKGIDVDKDKNLIGQIKNAEVEFLVEPTPNQFHQTLYDPKGWDILFFAGHSHTQEHQGIIFLNPEQSLTVRQLKNALTKAIQSGLQLAIFNSCDGIGLAEQLSKLNIPQVIVMREGVPDLIAQEFLKYFLQSIEEGLSVFCALRQARERLQGWDTDFPGASWLPMMCQNPASEGFVRPQPNIWNKFVGQVKTLVKDSRHYTQQMFKNLRGQSIVLGGISITLLSIVSLNPYVRKVKISQTPLKIAVSNTERYQELVNYIEENTVPANFRDYFMGKKVEVILEDEDLSVPKTHSLLEERNWHLVFTYSLLNSIKAHQEEYQYIASTYTQGVDAQGALVVSSDSKIKSLADIDANTKIGLGDYYSVANFYLPISVLEGKTVNLSLDHQDKEIKNLVRTGQLDVGTVIIGDSWDDSDLKVVSSTGKLPHYGVYASPTLSLADQRNLQKLLLNAPTDIKQKANYGLLPEPDYKELQDVIAKVETIMMCADFSQNPVTLACDAQVRTITGVVNGVSLNDDGFILRLSASNQIYNVYISLDIVQNIFGSSRLVDIQGKFLQVSSDNIQNYDIKVHQPLQIKLLQQ